MPQKLRALTAGSLTWLMVVTAVVQQGLAEASPFEVRHSAEHHRSRFWVPAISFLLPGLGQWAHGQYGHAATYSGIALAGAGYAGYNMAKLQDFNDKHSNVSADEMPTEWHRRVLWGTQTYQTAGGFSAYHAYRTALQTRRADGGYRFLPHDETPLELALAPFRFHYLKRSSTLLPLAIGLAIHVLAMHMDMGPDYERVGLSSSSMFYSGALSYNAGTHEEAVFRGWMMPEMMRLTESKFASNAITSLIFALAHMPSVEVPIAQLLLSAHLGHITQRDQWRISEAIFVHTWWDVFAFLTVFQIRKKQGSTEGILPPLMLPALTYRW